MWLLASTIMTFAMKDSTQVNLDKAARAKLTEIAFQAAREDDLKTLKEFFLSGFSVNQVNNRGDNLLTVAAYAGSEKAVTLILEQKGLEIDKRSGMGLTALAAAAFKGHASITKALCAKGATVDAANGSGQTALMFAALTGKTEVARELLRHGAKAGAVDKLGNTPLSLAKVQGASAMIALLESAQAKK